MGPAGGASVHQCAGKALPVRRKFTIRSKYLRVQDRRRAEIIRPPRPFRCQGRKFPNL